MYRNRPLPKVFLIVLQRPWPHFLSLTQTLAGN